MTINWHNVKMVLLLVAGIFSAGLAVVYPATGTSPMWVSLVSTILMAFEHTANGNTSA